MHFGTHAAVSFSVPAVHALEPVSVYPLLHVGMHELPLARLTVHGVATPLDNAAEATHALALQTTVSFSVPAVHALVPASV